MGKKILEALASGWLAWSERRGVGRHGGGLERVEGLGEQRGHGEQRQRLLVDWDLSVEGTS